MRKILGSLAVAASLSVVGVFASPALAEVPTGYAGGEQKVFIEAVTGIGGTVVSLDVRTEPAVPCDSWTVSIDYSTSDDAITSPIPPSTKSGGGEASFSVEFDTPVVQERTTQTATVVCNYTPASTAPAQAGVVSVTPASYSALPVVSQSCGVGCVTNSNVVTLLPRDASGTDRNGVLPGTGGAPVWLLVAGGILVVGGAAVAVAARRRSS